MTRNPSGCSHLYTRTYYIFTSGGVIKNTNDHVTHSYEPALAYGGESTCQEFTYNGNNWSPPVRISNESVSTVKSQDCAWGEDLESLGTNLKFIGPRCVSNIKGENYLHMRKGDAQNYFKYVSPCFYFSNRHFGLSINQGLWVPDYTPGADNVRQIK